MKCPNCKHDINFNKTYSDYEISAMMDNESKEMKILLKNIIIKIWKTSFC